MLNELTTDVKVVYGLNTLYENLKFNEDTRHDHYTSSVLWNTTHQLKQYPDTGNKNKNRWCKA